ncbi:cysteine-rich motor neuron 1 protein-like [Ascaphus truei]|uniref:cysteine-rich motor neuron 1 protein-like n=1 Tax=Ascaphus truei TaxID=8439 RepID=UPI003F5A15FD
MGFGFIVLLIFSCMIRLPLAFNCTACEERKCPPSPIGCLGQHAIDPCGCCKHCAKQEWEPCGGENWEHGYCDRSLKCAPINGTGLVEIPMMGICKYLRGYPYKDLWEDDDEICPVQSGCYVTTGVCECVTKRTCIDNFRFSSAKLCNNRDDEEFYEKYYKTKCFNSGCNIIDGACVCELGKCGRTYKFWDQIQCNKALVNVICANVTCPEAEQLTCPSDSVASTTHTPLGECCPTVPSFCTCDFSKCDDECPRGKKKILHQKAEGIPGSCCDKFQCLKDRKPTV